MKARALFHVAPGEVRVQPLSLPPLGQGALRVRAKLSGLSAGTERLVFEGRLPDGMALDESLAALTGRADYPFRYGYALVGEVVEAADAENASRVGETVFLFHPHQDVVVAPAAQCIALPKTCPPERALFLANMETAVALMHDLVPLLGEQGLVFGQGVVGLLLVALLQRAGLSRVVAVDPCPERRLKALAFGADQALAAGPILGGNSAAPESLLYDFAVELSGRPEVINEAIEAVGFDGRIIIGSWYGTRESPIALGSLFHRRRQRLVSSQVSTIAPPRSGRWSKSRRLQLALDCLDALTPERLITHRIPFEQSQEAFRALADPSSLQIILEYS